MRINWNGKRRWIALVIVILNIIVMLKIPPVIPVIQLPGEKWPGREILGLPITNTLFGSIIVWVLIILLIVTIVRKRPKSGAEVPPSGFYNFFEMLYEGLFSFIQGVAGGPYINRIFSFFMTIFLIVLLSNWLEIIPMVDSVGFLEPHVEVDKATGEMRFLPGFETMDVAGAYALNPKCPWVSPTEAATLTADEQKARADAGCVTGTGAAVPAVVEGTEATTSETTSAETTAATTETTEGAAEPVNLAGGEHEYAPGDPNVPWVVLPYVRTPSTDLNMTVALALIAVISIQAIGLYSLGMGYVTKFFPLGNLITKPIGAMDVAIGLLEFIGEVAKILSFSFRLLGNIFAGSILLFVISFLVPAIVPWALFLFEFGVGILQAFIFGMLTAIFMNTATIGHSEGHESHEGAAEAAH